MFGNNNKINYLCYIFSLALVLRLTVAFALENKIYWHDGFKYDQLATNLMAGKGYPAENGKPTSFRAPGYPLFLALNYSIFGHQFRTIRIIQSLLDSLTMVIVFLIARLIFNQKIAIISALIFATYPLFIYTANTFFPTTMFSFLLAATIFLLLIIEKKQTILSFFLMGVVLGLAVLTVPTLIAFIPFALLWSILILKKDKLRMILGVGMIILSMILTLSPWLIRNYYLLRSIAIATNGGYNFWMGNNACTTANSGNSIAIPESLSMKLSHTTGELEREQLFYADAFQFICKHPFQFIKLTFLKALNYWWLYPEPTTGYKFLPLCSKILSAITYGPILVLAGYGIFASWTGYKKYVSLFLALFLSFTLFHALFISKVRFRLPVDPYLIILASYSFNHIFKWKINDNFSRTKNQTTKTMY